MSTAPPDKAASSAASSFMQLTRDILSDVLPQPLHLLLTEAHPKSSSDAGVTTLLYPLFQLQHQPLPRFNEMQEYV
jgi:hypothetical protein